MKQIISVSLILLFFNIQTYAQELPHYHSEIKRTAGNSGTGQNIDVKYHRFEWYLNPDGPKNIQGSVTTYFVTTQPNVKTISFDFNKSSFDNSDLTIKYHGTTINHYFPANENVDILNIVLTASLPINRLDSVTISYSGAPPPVKGDAEGFQQKTISGSGTSMYFTLSESYEDKDWWPCKADMQDKVDSIDFIITTPSAFRAAANGVLVKETISGLNKTYYFKHRYPIASYLVAVAVAKYNVFNRGIVNIGGTEMPVEYYITIGRGVNPVTQLTVMDFVKQELIAFSEKFGDYPFKNEKYGMYEFGWGGGMEHQTFSAMSWGAMSNAGIIAHELMHQWFGDKVTFATWEHLWLAEGFARYGEALAAELIPAISSKNAATIRNNFKIAANGNILKNFGCIIPEEFIANSSTLWSSAYGSTVYERGAMVVSMLRTLVGDTRFFLACKNYLNDPKLAYGSAVTNDLQRHFEAVLDGFDLTPFFNSFAKGNGYPSYTNSQSIKWWPAGNGYINIGIDGQAKSTGSNVAYYFTPIPLLVHGANGQDSLIIIYDQNGMISKAGNGIGPALSSSTQFYLGFEPVSVSFDPYNMSLATGNTVSQMVSAVNILEFQISQDRRINKAIVHTEGTNGIQKIVLERSKDGNQFDEIGIMRPSPGAVPDQFILEDTKPYSVNYYRAKVIDIEGKIIYSKTVKVTGNETAKFSILNNPVSGNIKIKPIEQIASGTIFNMKVFDTSGKKHLDKNQKVNGDIIEIKNKLQRGIYFLKISNKKKIETTLRLVIL